MAVHVWLLVSLCLFGVISADDGFMYSRDLPPDATMPNNAAGQTWLQACLQTERDLRNTTTIGAAPLTGVHAQWLHVLGGSDSLPLSSTISSALSRGARFIETDVFATYDGNLTACAPIGSSCLTTSSIPQRCYPCNGTMDWEVTVAAPISSWLFSTRLTDLSDILLLQINLRFLDDESPLTAEPLDLAVAHLVQAVSDQFNRTLYSPPFLPPLTTSFNSLPMSLLMLSGRPLVILFDRDVTALNATLPLASIGFPSTDFDRNVTFFSSETFDFCESSAPFPLLVDDPRLSVDCFNGTSAPSNSSCAIDAETTNLGLACGYSTRHFLKFQFEDAIAHLWTWAANEPAKSSTVNCARVSSSTTRWYSDSCSRSLPIACRLPSSSWTIAALDGRPWQSATDLCLGLSAQFDTPRTPQDNAALASAMATAGVSTAWISANDARVEECWVIGDAQCWRDQESNGLSPNERRAVITVSVVGGVIVLLFVGVCLYVKGFEALRYVKIHKYEASLRLKRMTKFVPVPA